MWQDLFRQSIHRLSPCRWAVGPHLEEFVAGLARDRYSVETIRRSLCAADHFGRWLLAQDLALDDVPDSEKHIRVCTATDPAPPVGQWLLRFDDYLQRVVGAAPSTRQRYVPLLSRFLVARFGSNEPAWPASDNMPMDDSRTVKQRSVQQVGKLHQALAWGTLHEGFLLVTSGVWKQQSTRKQSPFSNISYAKCFSLHHRLFHSCAIYASGSSVNSSLQIRSSE